MPVKARQELLKTFTVDFTSTLTGERCTGSFTMKKLSVRDFATLGVRKAQLNGGMHSDSEHPGQGVDSQTDDLNGMIAHLELAIVDHPAWWKLDELYDMELVAHVYKEVLTHENSFLARASQRAAGTSENGEAASQEAAGGSHNIGTSSPVVVQKVSAALEP